MAHYRKATLKDCADLAPRLRQQDKQEVWDSHHLLPLQALLLSVGVSEEAFAIIDDQDEIVGIFGIAANGDLGIPWLLGADGLKEIALPFLRQGRQIVKDWNQRFPTLRNFVSADNDTAIEWLKWLGFEFPTLHSHFGAEGKPFYEFIRTKNV